MPPCRMSSSGRCARSVRTSRMAGEGWRGSWPSSYRSTSPTSCRGRSRPAAGKPRCSTCATWCTPSRCSASTRSSPCSGGRSTRPASSWQWRSSPTSSASSRSRSGSCCGCTCAGTMPTRCCATRSSRRSCSRCRATSSTRRGRRGCCPIKASLIRFRTRRSARAAFSSRSSATRTRPCRASTPQPRSSSARPACSSRGTCSCGSCGRPTPRSSSSRSWRRPITSSSTRSPEREFWRWRWPS